MEVTNTALVLAQMPKRKKPYLLEAPAFGNVAEGDFVKMDGSGALGTVLRVVTINPEIETDKLAFILDTSDAAMPLPRVRAVYKKCEPSGEWYEWNQEGNDEH